MNEDERLGPKVRAVLQQVIPEPPVMGSLLAGARVRVRRRRRVMAAGSTLGVAVVAAAVVIPTALMTTGPSPGQGEPAAARESTASASVSHPSSAPSAPRQSDHAAPAWTARCFSPWSADMGLPPVTAKPVGQVAPEFVGKSLDAVERQAAKEHFRVVVVGRAGHCQPWLADEVYVRHVYVALGAGDQVVAARDGHELQPPR